MNDRFDVLADIVRTRRTRKDFTGATIPRAELESVLDLARWAPTHRLSEPWRFYVLDQPAIAALMRFMASEPAIAAAPDPDKGAAKLAKLCERLPRLAALIQVTWIRADDPAIDLEDHAAAAAAVEHVLLAATARGFGSFWSTNPMLGHPLVLRWCGVDIAREARIGTLWLGHPADEPSVPPRRPLAERVSWVVPPKI